MAIKEILDRIKTALGADAPAETLSLLADAKREADTILDDLSSANRESKSRKEKLRELEAKQTELQEQIDKTSNNADYKAATEKARKYDELVATQAKATIDDWTAKYTALTQIKETDKRYKTIQSILPDFKSAAEGQTLSADDAAYNLSIYKALEKTGTFTDPTATPVPTFTQSLSTGTPGQTTSAGDAIIALTKTQTK